MVNDFIAIFSTVSNPACFHVSNYTLFLASENKDKVWAPYFPGGRKGETGRRRGSGRGKGGAGGEQEERRGVREKEREMITALTSESHSLFKETICIFTEEKRIYLNHNVF